MRPLDDPFEEEPEWLRVDPACVDSRFVSPAAPREGAVKSFRWFELGAGALVVVPVFGAPA